MFFKKKPLKVPYAAQLNRNACGAAVLEMVYNYYGMKDIFQEKLYEKYQELEPYGSGNYRLSTDNLVLDARNKGFISFWGRADYTNLENAVSLLQTFVKDLRVPVIVCQKFTTEQPLIGHFRVVLMADKDLIYFHDPNPDIGGASQKWPTRKFMEFWQPTGDNVTGGIFVIIKK